MPKAAKRPARKNETAAALHRLTIPVFIQTLGNMGRILAKAERHARARGVDMGVLLDSRLYADMYCLRQQLQYLCFIPAEFAGHFTAQRRPRVGYDEKTLADLKTSIAKTIAYLRKVKPAHFAAHGASPVPLFFDPSQGLPPANHIARFTLPNFFFHATVAYAILRHNGVPLGKADYIGPLGTRKLKKK
jgi:hypothetical protein